MKRTSRYAPPYRYPAELSIIDISQCRLVHNAPDQCAFILANCPDEEAGLISYLQLYYCKMPKAKPVALVIIILWSILLFSTVGIAASDFFCINLSTIASILGMSESMAGVTFLALGNGSPDVFSTFAAMRTNSGSLAVGELIGAAGFITAIVAGSMALVRPFEVEKKSFLRDVGFFIVAASFSMVFLADGHLYIWECGAMVAFYIFYVLVVMVWHWHFERKRKQKVREALIRGHHANSEGNEWEAAVQWNQSNAKSRRKRAMSRNSAIPSLIATDEGEERRIDLDEEADEEERERWMAEISNSMRLVRPPMINRRHTPTPIRPSLVGALEFRAVLASLNKSRNIQAMPLSARRYSDDPSYTLSQTQQSYMHHSYPGPHQSISNAHDVRVSESQSDGAGDQNPITGRVRAVSANDASRVNAKQASFQKGLARMEATVETDETETPHPPEAPLNDSEERHRDRPTLLETGPSNDHIRQRSPSPGSRGGFLAPPRTDSFTMNLTHSPELMPQSSANQRSRDIHSPGTLSPGTAGSSPRLQAFPAYHDDPHLRQNLSRESSFVLPPSYELDTPFAPDRKPLKWWPYSMLPAPNVLLSTLFPTLYSWNNKNYWEKMLGIMAAPSVFLLTITLPVVEAKQEGDDEGLPDLDDAITAPPNDGNPISVRVQPYSDEPSNPTLTIQRQDSDLSQLLLTDPETTSRPDRPAHTLPNIIPDTQPTPHSQGLPQNEGNTATIPSIGSSTTLPSAKSWSRWLVATQLFTAPLFVVSLVLANLETPFTARTLALPILSSLLGSLLALALLLLTTSPTQPPRYHFLLCFAGFVVSVAWISTIANEVVGVLKAVGVILGISDAILGLTVFAVGSSLGDWVADITVARLGYPVMALSACFGGPMLNILLGIGVSGLYITIANERKRAERHPGRVAEYRPYQIEVGRTLVVSGVTLLLTLVGLAIVVPLNGWRMDRKVGWGLVAVWTVSTLLNLGLEIGGWGSALS